MSDDAHRQVRDRLDLQWNDLGEHRVKNIARPVYVWHWMDERHPAPKPVEAETARRPSRQPAIAVLPFANMSGDPDQEYFAEGIVGSVAPETLSAEIKRATRKTPDELDAWDRVLQARWHLARFTEQDVVTARQKLLEAIDIDPDLASAFADLGNSYVLSTINGWGGLGAAEASKRAAEAARQAIQLDPADASANAVYGFIRIFRWEFDEGLTHLRRAVEYNPNLANAYGFLSVALFLTGDYAGGVEAFDQAVRLRPRNPWRGMWLAGKGIGAFIVERYDDVLEITRENIRDNPDLPTPYRQRAATLALLGRCDEAKVELERLYERMPNATIA